MTTMLIENSCSMRATHWSECARQNSFATPVSCSQTAASVALRQKPQLLQEGPRRYSRNSGLQIVYS
jgi:hypothetical protein